MEAVLEVYVNMMVQAVPIAFTIWIADLLVTTLMGAITGGYLRVGRVK